VFCAQKVVIVTQKYHLYRAVYIARALGLEAYGVAAAGDDYGGQFFRDIREVLARNKDFFTAIFQPKPTYTGEEVPVWGNGDITNDK
jgi:vancomycin permeability regulator SanA